MHCIIKKLIPAVWTSHVKLVRHLTCYRDTIIIIYYITMYIHLFTQYYLHNTIHITLFAHYLTKLPRYKENIYVHFHKSINRIRYA